jgi:hypothetical protein
VGREESPQKLFLISHQSHHHQANALEKCTLITVFPNTDVFPNRSKPPITGTGTRLLFNPA